ncbi:rab-like protein 3 [Phlebotomus papatasi]|uniref:rab-like protein 3 n=1 Tax=Phlebotomus papatasi TaxID=29031 RepID=UPI002483B4B9|nr:rab-like protein 3 [Phlebotomus papatasi]
MAAIDKVRVILVGDSGVGKTSLTHLIAHSEPLTSPGWTVGCSVEVKLHEYKEGTPQQKTFFVELWDIGGSVSHKNTRGVFYTPTHGVILVHDLTNRKSHENLKQWLMEIINKDGKDIGKGGNDTDFDPEQFLGATHIPILVFGTKLDLVDEAQISKLRQRSSITGSIAEQCGADEICLNCHDTRSVAAGTTDAVKLSRFFDKVIERKYFSKDSSFFNDKRKFVSPFTSPLNTPFNSPFATSSFSSPPTNLDTVIE